MREGRPFYCNSIGKRNTFRKTRIVSYVATMVMDQYLEVVMTYTFGMTATPTTNLTVTFLPLTTLRVQIK